MATPLFITPSQRTSRMVTGRSLITSFIFSADCSHFPITRAISGIQALSFLIAIPMMLFGKTISSALIAPIVAGLVPAVAGYLAGRYFSGSIKIGALTGILTFFSPFQVWFSTTTEAIIFAGAFGAIVIYFMMKGFKEPRFFSSRPFYGLGNLIRQDDILLLATLILCILLASITWKNKLAIMLAVIGIHVLILCPLMVKNYMEFHTLFPPGPAKTAFLTTYEDFHSFGKEIDWKTLRATWGIMGILSHRWHTAQENLGQVNLFLDPVFTVLFFISFVDTLLSFIAIKTNYCCLSPLHFLLSLNTYFIPSLPAFQVQVRLSRAWAY